MTLFDAETQNYIYSARHKTNANYGNLVYDKADKRVVKNLLYDSCLTHELGQKDFLTE